jgi:hypothetical protein
MRSIGFLAHDQSRFTRPKTFVSKDDADLLVAEMFAERISSKLIRAFAPDSPFRRLQLSTPRTHSLPEKIPTAVEMGGVHFQLPIDPMWREQHLMATRSLQTRAMLAFKAWQQAQPPNSAPGQSKI